MDPTGQSIVDRVWALRGRFPHLKDLTSDHFKPGFVQYQRGVRTVPNPKYPAELEAYERALAEPNDPPRKRPAPRPPEKEIEVYEENGVVWRLSWSQVRPEGMRAATGFPVPGYEAIELISYPGSYEATAGDLHIHLEIQGKEIDLLREAIFQALLSLAPPEQGALIACIDCTILYPERTLVRPCTVCHGRGQVFQAAQMADRDLSHQLFRQQWDVARAARGGEPGKWRSACRSALTHLLLYGKAYVSKEFGLEGEAGEAKVAQLQEEIRGWVLEADRLEK